MALSKITLKLGKKTIELTSKEFEELKRDMRELDKDHHYYWHRPIPPYSSPWYNHWYNALTYTTSAGSIGGVNSRNQLVDLISTKEIPDPPSFSGTVLSTS